MTQEEIIDMAKQAGFDEHHAKFDTRIETFAKLVAEKSLAEHAMRKVQRLGQEIEQEPVAWQFLQNGKWHNGTEFHSHRKNTEAASVPVRDLYTTPPQRKPLTDEEIFACENSVPDEIVSDRDWCIHFARAIEAKIKENT
jgi:hypothetical protein